MFISVVIPLYNKEKYIMRTINSVLNQTYNRFELIIVDDGSTDNSANIVRKIADKRIKLISQYNGGVSKARNLGVKNSIGEWVSFLDADDEYDPNFLQKTIDFIFKHENSNLSFVGTNYFLGDKKIAIDKNIESGIYDYFQLFRNQRSPNNSSTTTVKKSFFLEVGGFPEGVKNFEDWITWFKLACVGSFGYISDVLGIYYYIEDSVSRTTRLNSEFINNSILVPVTIKKYVNKYSLSPTRKKNAVICLSEFCFNMALYFSVRGEKTATIKMLSYANPKCFIEFNTRKKYKLFAHFFIPQSVKQFYRIIKQRL